MTTHDYISPEHGAYDAESTSVGIHKDLGGSAENIEETCPTHNRKRPTLSVDIPSKKLVEASVRINMPPITPSSASTKADSCRTRTPTSSKIYISPSPSFKGKSSMKNLLPKLSFQYRSSATDGESGGQTEKHFALRSLSFTGLFVPAVKRTSSSPVTSVTISRVNSLPPGAKVVDHPTPARKGVQQHISRSLSVPVTIKSKSIKRTNSSGRGYRIIPSTPRATDTNNSELDAPDDKDVELGGNDEGEDIPEEEALCRICMIELGEGGDTIKLECTCKGDLALAHKECVLKWFSIKGNRTCEVCKHEVQNLQVTLLRIQYLPATGTHTSNGPQQMGIHPIRLWLDMPVLVIISMLSYFCFLEQLLVFRNGSAALAISLPSSCILGLLASMTSSTMAKGNYIWVYASIQFVLVVFFAHLFLSVIHMKAMMSIVLATLSGFGIAMGGSSVIVEFLRWRVRSRASRHTSRDPPTSHRPSIPSGPSLHEHNSPLQPQS